jgi:hypothetical protein
MRPVWLKPVGSLIAAGIVFAVLVIDILVAKVQVAMGASIAIHLGDTGQFLMLLAAVVLFVIGTIGYETLASDGQDSVHKRKEK